MKKSWKSALALCLILTFLMGLCAFSYPVGAEGDAAGSGSDIREVSVRLDDANHTLRMVKQSDRWYICAEDLALLAGLATGVNEDTGLAYFVRRGESTVILYTGTDFIRRDGNIFVPAQEATVACGVRLMEYNGQLAAEILRTPKDLDQELYDHVFTVPVYKLERYIVEGGWVVGGFHFFSIWYDMITNPSRVFEYLTKTNDYSYYLNALTSLMTYDGAKVGLLNGFLTADKALIKVSKFFSKFDKASEKVALFYNKLMCFSDAEAEWKTFAVGIDVYGDFGPIRYFLLEDGGKTLKTLNSIVDFNQVKNMIISIDAEASSVSVVANVFLNSDNPTAQSAARHILAWYNGNALGAAYGVTDIFNNLLGMAVDTKLDDVLTGKVTFGSWLATAAEQAVMDWIFHTDKQVDFALYMPVYTDIQQTLALYYFSEKDQDLQSGDLSLMRGVALMYLNANLKVFDMLAFEDDLDLSATAQSVLAEMESLLSYDPDEFCPQYDNAILISYAEKAPAAVQDTAGESTLPVTENQASAGIGGNAGSQSEDFDRVGSIVTYGTYPQTKSGIDHTPIEWLVLDYDGQNNRALLISRYGLDCQPYNSSWSGVTWETCTLRTWLNDTFLNKAFNKEEQNAILLTDVDNSKDQCYSGWSTSGGNNTQDKVFLLSCAEVNRYFGVTWDDDRNAKARVAPTEYAVKRGAEYYQGNKTEGGEASAYWWLRSPGEFWDYAASVIDDGSLYYNSVSNKDLSVRPAIWLDLSGI